MANAVNGNTIKIDSTGTISITGKNIIVTCLIVTATANAAIFELEDSDGVTDVDKIRVAVDIANKTESLDLTAGPIVFPNGIKVKTVTNCEATLIFKRVGIKGRN